MPILWSLEVNKAILEQVKVAEEDDYVSISQETKTRYTKLVQKTGDII